MANGAGRIFNVFKQTSEETNTKPSIVTSLTVKSTNPLILTRDDKLEISEEFCVFGQLISKNTLEIGDVLTAFVFNEGQVYFLTQNESQPSGGSDKSISQIILPYGRASSVDWNHIVKIGNMVYINLVFKVNEAVVTTNTRVCSVPEGFRPSASFRTT